MTVNSDTEKPETTLIVFAGTSGVDKTSFIRNLVQASLMKRGMNPDPASPEAQAFVRHIKFEDELKKLGVADTPSFLEKPSMSEKAGLIRDAFDNIAGRLNSAGYPRYIFLEVHLSYTKRGEFAPPLDLHNFEALIPQPADAKVITLVDDIFSVWSRIKAKEQALFPQTALTLKEILSWRSVEMLQAETLAMNLHDGSRDRPVLNYLVSTRHPFEVFYNLIFQRNPTCIYLSYPITKTRDRPEMVEDINRHRIRMHEMAGRLGAVAFDPTAIDDDIILHAMGRTHEGEEVKVIGDGRWPLGYSPLASEEAYPVSVPYWEAREAKDDIINSIRTRDYKMIDSGTATVAYRPFLGGKSVGVDKEITYSVDQGKRVKVFNPDGNAEAPSPFDEAVEVFADREEFYGSVESFLGNAKRNGAAEA